MSNAQDVKEFTEAAYGTAENTPRAMTKDNVKFIIRMVMSELCELACTVTNSANERDELMQTALDTRDKCSDFSPEDTNDLIAAQFDALVDAWYYSLNVAAKHGVNMSKIFDIVHKANMAKRDPVTQTFLKRASDNKIIKPAGWVSPDISEEIRRQTCEGAWN